MKWLNILDSLQYNREFEAEDDGGEVLDLENDNLDQLFSKERDTGDYSLLPC